MADSLAQTAFWVFLFSQVDVKAMDDTLSGVPDRWDNSLCVYYLHRCEVWPTHSLWQEILTTRLYLLGPKAYSTQNCKLSGIKLNCKCLHPSEFAITTELKHFAEVLFPLCLSE